MRIHKRSSVLQKLMIDKAAKYFLTSHQSIKNKNIDLMFDEQPSLIEYFKYLDEGHKSEINKEIILQIITIIFTAIRFQKIKLKRIKFGKILNSFLLNSQMKNYFNSGKFEFDEIGFKEFWKNYKQKNILNYTYFAINNQYIENINEEEDGVFIFYTVKTISDVISESVK